MSPVVSPWFDFLSKFIYDESGIYMTEDKAYLLESRLTSVRRDFGYTSMLVLCRVLQSSPPAGLRDAVVDALTTNETSFFRDPHVFETFAASVLPELLRTSPSSRSLTVWSAACSTGQEALSVGILLHERFPELRSWNVRILGTDISHAVVQQASEGRYRAHEIRRGLTPEQQTRFFREEEGRWVARSLLTDRIEFKHHNLMAAVPPVSGVDVIFLRNVLFYFDDATRDRVLDRMFNALRPGGVLLLGGAESSTRDVSHRWEMERIDRSVWWRRPALTEART